MSEDKKQHHSGLNHTYFIVSSIIIVALGLSLWNSCNKEDKDQDKIGMYEAMQDELQTYKDKDSLNHGKIDLLYGDIANFKSLKVKDSSEIARLQKLVDKNTISATVFTSSTSNTVTGHTTVTFAGTSSSVGSSSASTGGSVITTNDSRHKHCCDSCTLPIYSTKYENKWENMNVIASKDSIQVKYKVFNDFSIVQKFEKRGKWPFRQDIPIIDVTNNNPHTETISLRAFTVEPPKPKRGRWFIAGGVAGLLAGFFIFK